VYLLSIINGRIITDEDILEGKVVNIEEGRIHSITSDIPDNSNIIDAKGNFVSPGFIDIHIHGAGGCDTMDGTFDSINTISKLIAKKGVTSFVPTTMTVGADEIKKAVKNIRFCIENPTDGANVLGTHLEGPFLSENAKGAHDKNYIKSPDIDFFLNLIGDDYSIIKTITVAPETDGAFDFIRFIAGHGIIASIGHSNGSYDDIIKSIGWGAVHSTHLYNAMRGFSHREPGVVGAIFDSRITTEFIADGIHIHFAAIRTALAVKGYQNCALVTDAMKACCMEDGIYNLGGQEVFVKDGAARLLDGTLAGSTLTLDIAVRNIMKNTSLNIMEAVSMATSVPARILRVNDKKGYIKPGYDADIIIFDPDINVRTTIVGGRVI
jgi:N-acetylglucosamine-6-phosphate deacetylase